LKNMPEKDDTWHGAMVCPQHAVVIFWEGSANVAVHALHKSNHQNGSLVVSRGKSTSLKGNPKFLRRLSLSFFRWSTYSLWCTVFKFGTFPG
jgi:hypothetical protein